MVPLAVGQLLSAGGKTLESVGFKSKLSLCVQQETEGGALCAALQNHTFSGFPLRCHDPCRNCKITAKAGLRILNRDHGALCGEVQYTSECAGI